MATHRPGQLAHAIDQVARQRWGRLQLVLVLHGLDLDPQVVRDKVVAQGIGDDIYGEHYLSDLVPAFSYTDADIVGKRACYVQLKAINATLLSKPETEHRYGNLVKGGTLLLTGDEPKS